MMLTLRRRADQTQWDALIVKITIRVHSLTFLAVSAAACFSPQVRVWLSNSMGSEFMIFLSYAREDRERASRIYSLISMPDRPVFYDKESLIPGMDWESEIEGKLAECTLILVLCSKHSVAKEGFIQREIRLALNRAERMPEGRIFIVPIRFDNIKVPSKLTRFHWLDINSDVDYFELEYFINLIWGRINGSSSVVDPGSSERHENALLREKGTILLQGKNLQGEQIYTYLELQLWKLMQLRNTMRREEDFMPSDYGEVLAAGKGEPPESLRQKMAVERSMIDVPKPGSDRTQHESEMSRDYLIGFTEGFKSVMGDDIEPPLVKVPDLTKEPSNPMRAGIRHGVRLATERMSDN
jgi:hypothetical protein